MNEINLFATSSKIPGTYSAVERSSLNSRLTPVTTPTWCGAFKRTGTVGGMQMFPLKIRSRGPRKRGRGKQQGNRCEFEIRGKTRPRTRGLSVYAYTWREGELFYSCSICHFLPRNALIIQAHLLFNIVIRRHVNTSTQSLLQSRVIITAKITCKHNSKRSCLSWVFPSFSQSRDFWISRS